MADDPTTPNNNPTDPKPSGGQPSASGGAPGAAPPSLFVNFMDPTGEAIPGIKFRLATPKGVTEGVSDGGGGAKVQLEPKTQFDLHVLRDDGTPKAIFSGKMPLTDAHLTAVAPTIKIPIKTEAHEQGAGGGAPPPPAAKPTAPKASGGGKKKPTVTPTRNEKGHPVATVKAENGDRKMSDIIGKGVQIGLATSPLTMGGYWAYRLYKWCKSGPKEPIKIPDPTKDDGKAIQVKVSEGDQKKFETLMDFTTKQAKWNYTGYGTNGALQNLLDKEWKPEDHPQSGTESTGRCYLYVKLALKMSGITAMTATPRGEAKYAAEEFLIPEGFVDVTEECRSDPYLALPGDVIVYKQIAYTRTQLKKINEADEADQKEKAGKWDKKKAKPKRPEKLEDRPGHIEIRTYDGFVSDYFKKEPVGSNAYQVTGIYRKVYDEKAKKRQDAFLKMLRMLETKEDWYILNASISIGDKRHFSDTSKHPWIDKSPKPLYPNSTAAGAYQITLETYEGCANYDYYGKNKQFDPAAQEHIAIRLLERQGKTSGTSALSLIRQGKIEAAIKDTELYGRWSCLPGGVAPQVKSMNEFIEKWRNLVQ